MANIPQELADAIGRLANSLADNERSGKIPFLSDLDAEKYQHFITHIKNQQTMYEWPALKTKQNIVKHLSGQAAALAAHLTIQVNDQAITAEAFIQNLDRIFIPMEQSPLAIAESRNARQKPEEPIALWHARCHTLYTRAFPDHAQNDKNRIFSFIHGIQNKHIQEGILVREPATYQDALQFANTVTASMVHSGRLTSPQEEGTIQALRGRPPRGGTANFKCHICAKPGHPWRDCIQLKKALTMMRRARERRQQNPQSRPPQPAGSNQGTRNMYQRTSRFSRPPFQGNKPRKVIASVEEEQTDFKENEEEETIAEIPNGANADQSEEEDDDLSDFINALGDEELDDFLGLT